MNTAKTLATKTAAVTVSFVAITGLLLTSGTAYATPTANSSTAAGTTAAPQTTAQKQDLQTIISKGNSEIDRRTAGLKTLLSKITTLSKLTANDKAYLTNEVNTEITGLTTLKTTLDAATTVPTARTAAQSIYTDYRVYALIFPKVWLVKTADDQQATETQLSTVAGKLQTRITTVANGGKSVTTLLGELADMKTQISNAQTISSGIETKVVSLQPSDYNSDHSLLSGDAAQLTTAHNDNTAAYNDAKTILSTLTSM